MPAATRAATFTYTGAVQSYTVPPDVSAVHVDATGGTGGGPSCCGYLGGAGGRAVADVPVTPGQTLYVTVGGNGGTGGGGYNGGGSSGSGYYALPGGGGGASDVRTASGVLSSRLIVAGGGGGGGGGYGGAAGAAGSNGSGGGAIGGGAGTTSGPGAGGGSCAPGGGGGSGDLGAGGGGGSSPASGAAGGGGGGGYYGGGGGGAWVASSCGGGNAAAGGGGASWATAQAINVSFGTTRNAPQVTVSPIPAPTCDQMVASTQPGARSVTVQLLCSSPSGFGITRSVVSAPQHGTLGPLDQGSGQITYTANAGYTGSDTFTYRATNAGGSSNTATVSITVVPAKPTCTNVHATTVAGGGATSVALTCTGPPGVAMSYAIVKPGAHGTLGTIDQIHGLVVYTPAAGYEGTDSFGFRAANAGGTSNTATATITVPPTNDRDHDHYDKSIDCDDTNPNVNPGASEIADNAVDENCDGVYGVNLDRDGDGIDRPLDCNDADRSIHPGAVDTPGDAIDQDCVGGPKPFPTLRSEPHAGWAFSPFRFTRLYVKRVPAGSRIEVRCRGGGCPFHSRKTPVRKARGVVSVLGPLAAAPLRRGATVEVRVTHPGYNGVMRSFKVQGSAKDPKLGSFCLPVRGGRPKRC